ncbi:glycine oxidase ThiO [Actinomadura sp. ATCC 31491]|uniref:glycine oxidase n=1 Tax=Actinomadura luzonensis TaxID=2805427 RepID=A0ABT0G857_9ACTN|nr:glycine oxidase ThiO [Actinomadura luzonensis]MCK2220772.1 glycine oxidase ThiO [Actinomadura luzonensis]
MDANAGGAAAGLSTTTAGLSGAGGGLSGLTDVVVGGGVVGLSVAWRLARAGRRVAVVDPRPARGASHAAAGMLAPISEVTYTEAPLLRLGMASLRRWPAFAAELAADAGLPATGPGVDLRAEGTLDVAFGADDLAALDELAAFMDKLGLPVERLTGRECRRLEPMLAPSVRGGLLAAGDAWVDPRRVTAALLAALERLRVPLVRARATGLLREDDTGAEPPGAGRVVGVRLEEGAGPSEVRAGRVVLAAGAWSGGLAGVPVRPVKGQILRLRSPRPLLTRCVRGSVHGSSVYLVPRGDGELVVGATQEELGFDTRVTAGGLYELLRDARELVPGVTELELADVVAGLRPGTPDNLPVIGPGGAPGLVLATGHHRGGVLLAPLTAALVAGESGGEEAAELDALGALCSPARFHESGGVQEIA